MYRNYLFWFLLFPCFSTPYATFSTKSRDLHCQACCKHSPGARSNSVVKYAFYPIQNHKGSHSLGSPCVKTPKLSLAIRLFRGFIFTLYILHVLPPSLPSPSKITPIKVSFLLYSKTTTVGRTLV